VLRCALIAAGIAALVGIALLGCRRAGPAPREPLPEESPDGPAWFADITASAEVRFVHNPGDVSQYLMYQAIGSGCAIHDLDGDGRPDLVLLTNAGPKSSLTNKLFRQKPDGTFEDVSAGSGLDFPGWNMGIAIGDVNNDGWPDIIVTQAGGAKLLLNLGEMKFRDVTAEAGIANPSWGTAAAFLDYDRDGWLDLVIVNYVEYDPTFPCLASNTTRDYCAPRVFQGSITRLLRNRGGNPVRFEDVTLSSQLGTKAGPGLGVAVADFDGDGWPDIFVANDGRPNHLWINQRNGTFREEGALRGVARADEGMAFAGMGVAVGDVGHDGQLDLLVTHLGSETHTLWKQGPRGRFRDRSAAWGLTDLKHRGTGFGVVLGDFDQDGELDLAIGNGRVDREPVAREKPGLSPHWQPYAERNQLLAGSAGRFRDISHNNPALCRYFTVARGVACGDVDGDGAPDLLINAIGEPARLLRNVAPGRGHWIGVRAIDPRWKRDAIGAEVIVRAAGTERLGVVASSQGFLSEGPAALHFGLGPAARVEELEVAWPDGTREAFPGGMSDRLVELRRGSGSMMK